MGASIALAGLNGCYRKPTEKIVPYVIPPEQLVAGKPLFYATAMPVGGYARGMIVEQNMGRPTKVEGNAKHPSTLGGTDVFMQAAPLGLCDPDRSQVPLNMGNVATWSAFENELKNVVAARGGAANVRIRVLSETVTSPTVVRLMERLKQVYPKVVWHRWQAFNRDNSRAGAKIAFGREVDAVYDFSKARRILSLDSDFLSEEPGSLKYALQFATARRVKWKEADLAAHHESARMSTRDAIANPVPTAAEMNRLYVIESSYTITGAKADHRLAVRPSDIEALARGLADWPAVAEELKPHQAWVDSVKKDLRQNLEASLVIAGENQPPSVHAMAHGMNARLNSKAVSYIEPVDGG